jgi:hypothetical protein
MTWQDDDYVTDVGNGKCPVCGRGGCMLKVRFRGAPARSLDRPITAIYTNCSPECPGGINTQIWGSDYGARAMPRDKARSFLNNLGNDLAHEMARRI